MWGPAVLGTEIQSLLERISFLSQASIQQALALFKTLPGSVPFFPAWQGDATEAVARVGVGPALQQLVSETR